MPGSARLAQRLATVISAGRSAENNGVVIFDKDGTLFSFHRVWGAWAENQAEKLENATGVVLASSLFDRLGYCQVNRRVKSDKSPLAYAPMSLLRSMCEDVAAAELVRQQRLSNLAAKEHAVKVVDAAWTEDHHIDNVQPMTTDLPAMLRSLRRLGFKTAVCTADSRPSTMKQIEHYGLAPYLDYVVCDDKTHAPKPSAETAFAICKRVGAVPHLSFVVGDTATDLKFGKNAGMDTVGVLSGAGGEDAMRVANHVIDSVDSIARIAADLESDGMRPGPRVAFQAPRHVTTPAPPPTSIPAGARAFHSTVPAKIESTPDEVPPPAKKTRGIADVWKLVPNQIDYGRIVLGMAPLFIPLQYFHISAASYLISHGLDQVDGRVARKLKQQSDFGMMLDYTIDIVTQACFFMKMCSIQPAYVIPCATVVAVESAGMVLAIHSSASGRYWKSTDPKTPWILRDVVMKNGVYTPLGDSFVFGHQCFVTATFVSLFTTHPVLTAAWWALLPVSLMNFWANSGIVYELLRKWQEPAK